MLVVCGKMSLSRKTSLLKKHPDVKDQSDNHRVTVKVVVELHEKEKDCPLFS
jgi:hypothetical protein